MLVLSRKKNEIIVIKTEHGEEILVILVDTQGDNKARIGIDAPSSVKVHRKEVYDKIERAKSNEQPLG